MRVDINPDMKTASRRDFGRIWAQNRPRRMDISVDMKLDIWRDMEAGSGCPKGRNRASHKESLIAERHSGMRSHFPLRI